VSPSTTWGRPLVVLTTIAILLPVERGLATFFFDFFAGSATTGFGRPPSHGVGGTGMFFMYASAYLPALLTLLPVLLVPRFGVATLVYVPLVVIGFPINYYYEWITEHTWVTWWSGIGWTAAFLVSAFSVDATYALLSGRVSERTRAILGGMVFGLVTYVATVAALALVYRGPLPRDAGSFVGLTYFGLPWLLVHSACGAYTAHAIARRA
jgi:hypothetical protein